MHLFQRKDFKMHSGGVAHYKIECDALTGEDLKTLAWMISRKGMIRDVYGVPGGGLRLAATVGPYRSKEGVRLIVDDVLTTGESMEAAKRHTGRHDAVGVVIFARGPCPGWILPIFSMEWINTVDELESPPAAEAVTE